MIAVAVGCKSKQETVEPIANGQQTEKRNARPSVDDVFEMDTNNDGKLSKSEVKGPLEKDFDKIDSNGDGFITKEELNNAPKPQRKNRPNKSN